MKSTMIVLKDLSRFDKTVRLLFANSTHRGPGMVVRNLTKGLDAAGLVPIGVHSSVASSMTGVLQFCHPELINELHQEKAPALMGPNLFVLPTDNPSLCKMFDHFVVPSQWVKEKYQQFDLMKEKDIQVWSVGIDTEEWKPVDRNGEIDCLIYHKNRSAQDLAVVEAVCRKYKLNYKVLEYGKYQEKELRNIATEQARFAILCTGTESQGIAYMQMLSSDLPCYVFNNPTWKSEDGKHSFKASSVPLWDKRCGYKSDKVDLGHFEEFLEKVDDGIFAAREYILEHHTLEKAAQSYYNLLRRAYGKESVEF